MRNSIQHINTEQKESNQNNQLKTKEIGLYVHFPFCKSKCIYCDFCSFAGSQNMFLAYYEHLQKEIEIYKHLATDCIVTSVFFGGGTPSFFDTDLLVAVAKLLHKNFNIDSNAEFTVEGNPDSITQDFAQKLCYVGANRFSIGLQSSSDKLLSVLKRPHNFDDFCRAIQCVSKYCDNVNVDIMVGLPYQTQKDVSDTLSALKNFDIKHTSVYGLILEKSTPLYSRVCRGSIVLPNDEQSVDMYEAAMSLLQQQGIERYEISNFSKSGYECRHNINCWSWGEYIGLGLSAHGFLNGERYKNHKTFKGYFKKTEEGKRPISSKKIIEGEEAVFEFMITNLRKTVGFKKSVFEEKFGMSCSDKYGKRYTRLLKEGLIAENSQNIFVPPQNLYVINQILTEFVPSKE